MSCSVRDSLKVIFSAIKLVDRAGFGIFQVGIQDDSNSMNSNTVGSTGAKKAIVQGEGREIWVPLNSCLLDYDPQRMPLHLDLG